MAVAVDLPVDVERRLRAEWPGLERHALEGFVVEAYRGKRIGVATAGRLLGFTDRRDTVDFLSERGVYPNYDLDDLEDDRRAFHALEASGTLCKP